MMININNKYKECCIFWLAEYWLCGEKSICELPISDEIPDIIKVPVKLVAIKLPDWAAHIGVDGKILIPEEANPNSDVWHDVNWWYVIYWYVTCQAEQEYERLQGVAHSYTLKFKGWDARMWDHAWVNRIAIFLDLWAQFSGGSVEKKSRKPELIMSHDLDAISKTWSIRLKQTAFNMFNCVRFLFKMKFKISYMKLMNAMRFLLSNDAYNYLDIIYLERRGSLISRQIINVYGGYIDNDKNFKSKIIDPNYDISDPELVKTLNYLYEKGIEIGLHQSTRAWDDEILMSREREYIESSLDLKIKVCRQHWLKFSFFKTWRSQSEAGLVEDMTLGFNNRIGFRNGCALSIDISKDSTFNIENEFHITPMILMDSQLYDYEVLSATEIDTKLRRVLIELNEVRGVASVIWHSHTLGPDYGWREGYHMLNALSKELYTNE